MNNWKSKILLPTMLVLMSSVLNGQVRSTPEPMISAQNSPGSAIRVRSQPTATATGENVVRACATAAEELSKTRVLVTQLEAENALLARRLETEKNASIILGELNETRKHEAEALRSVIDAKNETIAAKDSVIVAQDKLVESLKPKKASPWSRIGGVLIGAAAVLILR